MLRQKDAIWRLTMALATRILAGLAAATLMAATGEARAGCGEHVVQRGDTLRTIAIQYFGTDTETQRLFEMNRAVIGDNIDLIEVGQVLRLPCPGGALGNGPDMAADAPVDGTRSFAALKLGAMMPEMSPAMESTAETGIEYVIEEAPGHDAPSLDRALELAERMSADTGTDAAEAMPMPKPMPDTDLSMVEDAVYAPPEDDGVLYLLTGGPFPPFVDTTREAGGLIPHLVEAALSNTPEPVGFEIGFVNDQAALLATIMPRGGFDLTFPWFYPDCSRTGLDEAALNMCQTYLASDPVYEMVTEFYTRADSPRAGALVAADLNGATLCRPVGAPVSDLEAIGLLPDSIDLVRGASPSECLRRLDEGMVDVASMDGSVARTLIQSIGITQPLVVLDRFTRVETLHVLAPRSDPRAQDKLDAFNAGLFRISESGEWFEIVNKHINVQ